jgi:hypothetical protein
MELNHQGGNVMLSRTSKEGGVTWFSCAALSSTTEDRLVPPFWHSAGAKTNDDHLQVMM